MLGLAACSAPDTPRGAEILWDTWGVPHIYAGSDTAAFRAYGYAQMQSHGDLILKLYGEARGRSAEYWGPDQLELDRYVRTMGIPARAAEWLDAQTPAFRANLEAFAAGANQYAKEHGDLLAPERKVVLPITATDLLAHTQLVTHFTFVYGQERLIRAFQGRPGSNMWAVAPSHSASGNAMLLMNPHLAWTGLQLFYEGQIVAPGLDFYGVSLVGFPVPALGFNDDIGWSHTVNTIDAADTYRLTKVDGGYRWDGGVKPFETSTEVIKVKQSDGRFTDDTLTIKRSVHGPVVADSAKVAIAVRVAGLDQPGMLEEWWDMMHAKNLGEFESIVKRLQIPMFNIMYAGRDGHIFYLFGGRVPERSRGDVAYWRGSVPGDSSATLWTGTLPYEKLPHLTDPATGWFQNANDPPWTVTIPSPFDPDTYPAYLAPRNMAFRPQRSAHMLLADSSITFDEMVSYKHSTRMELADRLLDELIAAARATGTPKAKAAADVLERWDRQAQASSQGAVLFFVWTQNLAARTGPGGPFLDPWKLDSATTTPRGLADPKAAVEALDLAAQTVEKNWGAMDVAWGEVMRARYAGRDLPGNGAPGDPLGVFRTAYYVPDSDGKFRVVAGDTFYGVVEFGTPLRAKVLTAYGNSSQPRNMHFGDQLELWAGQQLRDVWRTRAEIEAHLEARVQVQ